MNEGTTSLRIAVCFFTDAGRVLLQRHAARLRLETSFFVASVDLPTDLKSMERLYHVAPGQVYIHLGGVTPEEKKVGRSLMHSKVVLAENDESCKLWVGSHNLTAMAIAGGNFEAATMLSSPLNSEVVQDAINHLELCRSTAEQFNPDDMERYREIQRRRWGRDWESERNVLVIHAEASEFPSKDAFIARIQIAPTELDRLIRNDRPVRLFLHPPGALVPGRAVDYEKAARWTGEVTAVVRTELHPRHRGARADFTAANFEIDVADLHSVPVLRPGGRSTVDPRTQAVISVGGRGLPRAELYSIGNKSPATFALDSGSEQELSEIDEDMARYFTPESIRNSRLIYRQVEDVRQDFTVRGYAETVRTAIEDESLDDGQRHDVQSQEVSSSKSPSQERRRTTMSYQLIKPQWPIDPFFYLSGYAIQYR